MRPIIRPISPRVEGLNPAVQLRLLNTVVKSFTVYDPGVNPAMAAPIYR
jgi:hypothetical protein